MLWTMRVSSLHLKTQDPTRKRTCPCRRSILARMFQHATICWPYFFFVLLFILFIFFTVLILLLLCLVHRVSRRERSNLALVFRVWRSYLLFRRRFCCCSEIGRKKAATNGVIWFATIKNCSFITVGEMLGNWLFCLRCICSIDEPNYRFSCF